MSKKYNHMFDIAFTVETEDENSSDVQVSILLAGLAKRLADLLEHPSEAVDAFGACDTYMVDEPWGE